MRPTRPMATRRNPTVDPAALAASYWPAAMVRVRSIAARSNQRHLIDEFTSVAAVAVCEAAQRFDPSSGVPFGAYASIRLSGAIKDYLRECDPLPRSQRRLVAAAVAADELGPTASEAQRLAASGLTADERAKGRALRGFGASVPIDGTVMIQLVDSSAPDPQDVEGTTDVRDELLAAMAVLDERSRHVVTEVYLRGRTQQAVGDELGVTESRICQICRKATDAMRNTLVAAA